MLKCRPFYLPRELSAVFISAVYVHPQANAKIAMGKLFDAISNSKMRTLKAFFLLLVILIIQI